MPRNRSNEGAGRRRYARRSTKSRLTVKPPRHPGRLIALAGGIVAVIVLALLWGSILDRRAEAYREQESDRAWMLDEDIATPHPTDVPELSAVAILPEQNTAPALSLGHGGVLLPLQAPDKGVYFSSAVALEAGMTPVRPPLADVGDAIPADGLSLVDEVARIARRGLRVIAVFEVTYPTVSDVATRAYRRGLELSLLAEYATAGMEDILIIGLTGGDDQADREAVSFITELRALTEHLSNPPAFGTVLPLEAFRATKDPVSDDAPLYAGRLTPGRMEQAFDFLVLDLRPYDVEELEEVLPHLSYAYVRHALRLLVADDGCASVPRAHGFTRIFEMPRADAASASST